MKRREFLQASAAIGAATVATVAPKASRAAPETAKTNRFKLKYAPHFNMFKHSAGDDLTDQLKFCLLYTSPSPRDRTRSRMPSSA